MRARSRALAFTVTLAVVALAGRDAGAFVQAVSMEQYPLSWVTGCESVTIYLNGYTGMTPDEVAKSIAAAAAAWGPGQVTCPTSATTDAGKGHPSFEIITELSTGGSVPGDANDGKNSIIFVTDPAAWAAQYLPYNALAFTDPHRLPSGQIVDADIEINATNPEIIWANLDPGVTPTQNGITRFDLQTMMTHEFGHFLGLTHTCQTPYGAPSDTGNDEPASGLDDQGQKIPDCTTMPDASDAKQAAAVMWYTVDPGVTAKRVLTSDDARGVCSIYPSGAPATCSQNTPDDGCGCTAPGSRHVSLLGAALATAALVRRRRPPRR
jgi:hypothetical protein